ncbi:MAG: hypothetical protein M3Q03_10490 [Chloroflexota bacterium]|nr:hypothetical protein [Chloroflexota bacterium]
MHYSAVTAMTWGDGGRPSLLRPRWWMIATLLVVGFVGHDIFMARATHAAEAVTLSRPAHHPAVDLDSGNGDERAFWSHETSTRDERAGCMVVRPMMPPGDDNPTVTVPAVSSASADEDKVASVRMPSCVAPGAPPGVHRALLQVFLI